MARFEIAVPADPARACPSAGRPGPVEVVEGGLLDLVVESEGILTTRATLEFKLSSIR